MNSEKYDFQQIEQRWRQHWLKEKTFKTSQADGSDGKPKCYILDMFPYPSGSGLHIGHPKGYIATDIYSRFKRMSGYNVLHPMGFDSFGLPAEQFAIEHNVHPAVVTEENIDNIREQLQFLGLSYDWDREIATSREDFYRWTQWIFLQLFNSYFDPDHTWQDANGVAVSGKARSIDILIEEFNSGNRRLNEADATSLGQEEEPDWQLLSDSQQQIVLNNYRLVYQKEVTVNWCPKLGTVLSNEEVSSDGRSERGDFPVFQRPLRQWIMRITTYADRMLYDLDAPRLPDGKGGEFSLNWPEPVKLMQRNWIGLSQGAEVDFEVLTPGTSDVVAAMQVFTTRADTLFGATFMAVAPQHPLFDPDSPDTIVPDQWPESVNPLWCGTHPNEDIKQALGRYKSAAALAGAVREEREKTGVFSGVYARNPVSGREIPIFVADYVSMDYGTGAIMAVPAHDERDFEFAQKFDLDVIPVVQDDDGDNTERCYSGEGVAINSPVAPVRQDNTGQASYAPYVINGLPTAKAKEKITAALEANGIGKATINYKLRDWIFSRQRYWGEPFPLAVRADGTAMPIDPPVLLPPMEDFRPATSDDPDQPVSPPLSRAPKSWLEFDVDGETLSRELNVMPQWAGSCWYYLRFIDPSNKEDFCDAKQEQFFMPVDLYVGGAEHAVLHLLYARFWHKVLYDLGHVSTPEPFKQLFNQGMITADAFTDQRGSYVDIRQVEVRGDDAFHRESGEKLNRFAGKMGKRYKNGLPPEEVGEEYGVDTLRLYEMYMGPLEASTPWSMDGIKGMQRFLQRIWRNFIGDDGQPLIGGQADKALLKKLNQAIKKTGIELDHLRFNTAIATLISLNNDMVKLKTIPIEIAQSFLLLLNPLAPHISEEIWSRWGLAGEVSQQDWPQADETLLKEDTMTLPVQINGKARASIEVAVGMDDEQLRQHILGLDVIKRHVPDPEKIKRFIIVPKRIVNIVVG
jgi:leucyl-tRNA synthetase